MGTCIWLLISSIRRLSSCIVFLGRLNFPFDLYFTRGRGKQKEDLKALRNAILSLRATASISVNIKSPQSQNATPKKNFKLLTALFLPNSFSLTSAPSQSLLGECLGESKLVQKSIFLILSIYFLLVPYSPAALAGFRIKVGNK
jgi:hypothetical protein